MIKKKYRLKEREVKKVLKHKKPFFSYGIILNFLPNGLNYNRFAIIIGTKSVSNTVSRNFFKRLFYNLVSDKIENQNGLDLVFLVKKEIKLDKKDLISINNFKRDINFLIKKINLF